MSAFSQWRAAASNADLEGFLSDTALLRTTLASISKQQASSAQLAKAIADKTEAGAALRQRQATLTTTAAPSCCTTGCSLYGHVSLW